MKLQIQKKIFFFNLETYFLILLSKWKTRLPVCHCSQHCLANVSKSINFCHILTQHCSDVQDFSPDSANDTDVWLLLRDGCVPGAELGYTVRKCCCHDDTGQLVATGQAGLGDGLSMPSHMYGEVFLFYSEYQEFLCSFHQIFVQRIGAFCQGEILHHFKDSQLS